MKKFIIGLVLILGFVTAAPTYALFGTIDSGLDSIESLVYEVDDIIESVDSLFGTDESSSSQPDTGLFDGEEALIYEGESQGGLNIGVDNVVSSGVVIVQDFDAIFESIEGQVGITPTGEFVLPDPEKFNQIGENTSLRQYILNVLNFALSFLGIVAVVFIIYAGYLYVVSAGDDGNMEKAKKIVLYAVIGILIILAAYALVNTVLQNAGRGTGDRGEIPDNPNGRVTTLPGGVNVPGGVQTPGGSTTGNRDFNRNLQNLVTVSGTGVQDFGSTAVATPEGARAGITFGLSTQAQALFDFGDGTQAILSTVDNPGATIVHPYGEARSYPVRVILENAQGSFPVRKEIVVGGIKAEFNMNRAEVSVGESLQLDANASTATVGSISAFNWACSGPAGCFADTTGRNASVSFSTPGEYTVTLTVENVLGITDSMSKTIRVIGGAPVAGFTYQSAGNSQRPAEFVFNATQSVNRTGTTSGLTYFWNFDGDFRETQANTINYEFNSVGSKPVELVVVETIGGNPVRSEAYSLNVEVETVLPVDFTVE